MRFRLPPLKSITDRQFMLALWALGSLGLVIYALILGPDINFDLKNYHYYNAYAVLNGVFDKHMFPAQVQSWFAPTLDFFFYGLIVTLSPVAFTIVLTLIQAAVIPLLFIIAKQGLKPLLEGPPLRRWATLFCAVLIGATGPMTLGTIRATFGDNTLALFFLGSIALLGHVHALQSQPLRLYKKELQWILLAGFLAGLGVGLKITGIIFAPAFALCFLWLEKDWPARLRSAAVFGGMALAGILLAHGWWLWKLWAETGNPLFPMMNRSFQSPLFQQESMMDMRFAVKTLLDAILFPYRTLSGAHPGGEVAYRDGRFLAVFLLLPFFIWKSWKAPRHWGAALVCFVVTTFLIWLPYFGIQRYITLLEMLSGVALLCMLGWVARLRFRFAAIIALTVFVVATTTPAPWMEGKWDQVGGPNGNWFKVDVPAALDKPDIMYLMVTNEPMAYAIPFFRKDATFVRMPGGNFNPRPGTGLYEKRAAMIKAHKGPFYSLAPRPQDMKQQAAMKDSSMRFTSRPCVKVTTGVETLLACPLSRR